MLVCEKVKQKVTTTYNEVADELVADYAERQKYQQQAAEQGGCLNSESKKKVSTTTMAALAMQ